MEQPKRGEGDLVQQLLDLAENLGLALPNQGHWRERRATLRAAAEELGAGQALQESYNVKHKRLVEAEREIARLKAEVNERQGRVVEITKCEDALRTRLEEADRAIVHLAQYARTVERTYFAKHGGRDE